MLKLNIVEINTDTISNCREAKVSDTDWESGSIGGVVPDMGRVMESRLDY